MMNDTGQLSERWKRLFADAQPKSILGEFPHPEWGDEIAALEAKLSKTEEALAEYYRRKEIGTITVESYRLAREASEALAGGGDE